MTDRIRPPWDNLPHGEAIDALLDTLHDLTDAEVEAMSAAWFAASFAAWYAARDAAWDAALGATLVSARGTAQDAALALAVADLVGQHGLTREHLDVLTGPARTIPRLAKIIDRVLPTKES